MDPERQWQDSGQGSAFCLYTLPCAGRLPSPLHLSKAFWLFHLLLGLGQACGRKILQESPMLCGPSRVIHFSIRCGCVLSDGGARVHCSLVWGRTGTCTRGWRRSRRAGWTTWRSRPSGGPARPPPSPWTPGGTPRRSCSTSRCRPPSPTNSQSDFYWAFYCIYNFDHQVVSLILY